MSHRREGGQLSLVVLAVIVALSVLLVGVSLLIQRTTIKSVERLSDIEIRTILEGAVMEVITELFKDPTPFADSLIDPIWKELPVIKDKFSLVSLVLGDISSLINPFQIRQAFFEQTELKILLDNQSPADFDAFRQGVELSANIDLFAESFTKEAFETFFSGFSWFNPNTTSYAQLEKALNLRVDSFLASSILEEIRLADQQIFPITSQKWEEIISSEREKLYPVFNVEAQFNIHFTPEFILKEILTFPFQGKQIPGSSQSYLEIMATRENTEYDLDQLRQVIPAREEEERVFAYLGVQTWFWEITAVLEGIELGVVIGRVPNQEGDSEKSSFILISKRYGEVVADVATDSFFDGEDEGDGVDAFVFD